MDNPGRFTRWHPTSTSEKLLKPSLFVELSLQLGMAVVQRRQSVWLPDLHSPAQTLVTDHGTSSSYKERSFAWFA